MSKTAKNGTHTPGPWKLNDSGRADFLELCRLKGIEPDEMEGYMRSNDGGWYVSNDDGRIAVVDFKGKAKRGEAHKSPDPEGFSNALVIAAAPTMFDFIKTIADEPCYENPGEFPEEGESGHAPCLSCQARAVIAQASGGPK